MSRSLDVVLLALDRLESQAPPVIGMIVPMSRDSVVPAATVSVGGGVDVGRALIPLGTAIELPIETVGRIASRSGLSVNYNLEVGAGWTNSDYRGDRIAQLILLPTMSVEFVIDAELRNTSRGASWFGSTGM